MPERRVSYETTALGQLTGIEIEAPSLQRLFIDAALALNDYRVALDLVKGEGKEVIEVEAPNADALLFTWLNACAALHGTKKFLACRIVFDFFDGKKIRATLTGETFVSTRHGFAQPFTAVAQEAFEKRELSGFDGGFSLRFFLK